MFLQREDFGVADEFRNRVSGVTDQCSSSELQPPYEIVCYDDDRPSDSSSCFDSIIEPNYSTLFSFLALR